jgi:SAM-dependent methyltransferase
LSNARTTASRSTEAADRLRLLDAFYTDFDEDLPFWFGMAQRFGGPVLELGSGSGRVLRPLAEAGLQVVGVDHDPLALRKTQRLLELTASIRVGLIQAELPNLPLGGAFPLTIVPCNTFAYFDDAATAALLRAVRRLLPPGAGLALDLPGPAAASDVAPGAGWHDHFEEPATGSQVEVSAHQGPPDTDGAVPVVWQFDELLPDGHTVRHHFELRYHPRSTDALQRLLDPAGFRLAETYGGYDGRPYLEEEPTLLVLALAVA